MQTVHDFLKKTGTYYIAAVATFYTFGGKPTVSRF